MSIHPLPQFESDLAEHLKEKEDREAYERLNVPTTLVVRFGYTMMVGEFPYSGDTKPGCGSKIVVRTHRGTEIGEMLTSTCRNSGCSKSVTRKEMLEYIENSGGRKYPFFERGSALRIATKEDLDEQSRLDQKKHELRSRARTHVEASGLDIRLVEVEPIIGAERLIVYYGSEDRVDFRDLLTALQREFDSKIDLVQVGSRDEARITADYERCGQYCCCKNFLKVLKPVSMKSAKVQKATLDPLKISGRCGRLMCCLRYEDETYEELRKNLPNRKKRVGTPDGDGIVIDTQILTQLARVRLDSGTDVAVPVEELTEPESATMPERVRPSERPRRPRTERRDAPKRDRDETSEEKTPDGPKKTKKKRRRRRRSKGAQSAQSTGAPAQDTPHTAPAPSNGPGGGPESSADSGSSESSGKSKKKRRRRRRRRRADGESGSSNAGNDSGGGDTPSDS